MKDTLVLAVKLFVITAVSALILSVVNVKTQPVIAQRELDAYNESLAAVYPDADDFESIGEDKIAAMKEKDEQIDDVVFAKKGDETIGYVVKAVGQGGYGGPVEIVVGINNESEIVGFQVLKHQETPGIGDQILEDGFVNSVVGTKVDGPVQAVKEPSGDHDIQAISGATYSTTAVLNGINAAVTAMENVTE